MSIVIIKYIQIKLFSGKIRDVNSNNTKIPHEVLIITEFVRPKLRDLGYYIKALVTSNQGY